MALYAEDLLLQREAMYNVSYMISTQIFFRDFYLKQDPYNDIVMLQEFSKFQSNSPIIGDYFLLYTNSDDVFLSTGAKTRFDFFCNTYGLMNPEGSLYETIMNTQAFSILSGITGNENLVVLIPVRFYNRKMGGSDAVVGFFVSPAQIHKRQNLFIGGIDGTSQLYYQGELFLTLQKNGGSSYIVDVPDDPVTNIGKMTLYRADTHDGLYTVVLALPKQPLFFYNEFIIVNTVYLLFILILALLLTLIVTHRIFVPIKKLINNLFVSQTALSSRNEFFEIEKLFEKMQNEKTISETMIADLTQEVQSLLQRASEAKDKAVRREKSDIEKIISYIDINLTDASLCLDKIAHEFHLTNRYISKLINQKTGYNYQEYLTRLRIAYAQQLLRGSNMTVAKLYESAGYSSSSYFIKAFKQISGSTPTEYLKQINK